MRPNKQSGAYLAGLDGWRAIAVTAVLLDHTPPFGPARLQRHLQNHGEQGVWLFFAISGLLICSRMLDEEKKFGVISLRDFYVRRAFRILPAALLYLLVVALLGALHVLPFAFHPWISAIFFYRNYWSYLHLLQSPAAFFTGHYWSLSVEEHFYLLLPGLMVLFPLRRLTVLGCLAVACLLWLAMFLVMQPSPAPNYFWPQRTEFCLIALLSGAMWAIWMQNASARAFAARWFRPWMLVIVMLAMTWFDSAYGSNLRSGLQLVARALLNPIVLLATVLHPASRVTRLLETRPFRYLGTISYSVYLWQPLFLVRNNHFSGPIATLQTPAVGILCTLVLSMVSYHLVESPLIRFGRRFARKREAASAMHYV